MDTIEELKLLPQDLLISASMLMLVDYSRPLKKLQDKLLIMMFILLELVVWLQDTTL
jgi:hypothetical protein